MAVGVTLLTQAKLDDVKVFKLIDTLKGYEDLQLSSVVAEVLNYNRKKTSAVGFKRTVVENKVEKRNIIEGSPVQVSINSRVQNNFSATGFSLDSAAITWDGV